MCARGSRDYNVFPIELHGVPPDREIKFDIDLELRTEHIFILFIT